MRRKLTPQQKAAAAARLAAARAKKGEPKYSQYDQTVYGWIYSMGRIKNILQDGIADTLLAMMLTERQL